MIIKNNNHFIGNDVWTLKKLFSHQISFVIPADSDVKYTDVVKYWNILNQYSISKDDLIDYIKNEKNDIKIAISTEANIRHLALENSQHINLLFFYPRESSFILASDIHNICNEALYFYNFNYHLWSLYGEILIEYRGPKIDRDLLMSYLLCYQKKANIIHYETLINDIFIDIFTMCNPLELTLYMQFIFDCKKIKIEQIRSNCNILSA